MTQGCPRWFNAADTWWSLRGFWHRYFCKGCRQMDEQKAAHIKWLRETAEKILDD